MMKLKQINYKKSKRTKMKKIKNYTVQIKLYNEQ